MNLNYRKKVLITGAQGALGSRVVDRFLESGFQVTGTIIPNKIESAVDRPNLEWLPVDLADTQSVKKQISGRAFDILIHCAGGFRYLPIEQVNDEDLDFLMNTNLRSAFLLAREVIPSMKRENFGRIVLISARATLQAGAGMAPYAASKAGLNVLTSALAEETKSFDINVNAILPTIIDTPANRKDMPHAHYADWVSPEQLAEIIFWLTSPFGKPIHGALIPVSGRL